MRSLTTRDFVVVLFRHKGLIVSSFLAIFLGVAIGTYMLPKQYETQMKILVKRERADPVVTPDANSQFLITQDVTLEDLNSEVELLKSRDLLEKVVIACELDKLKPDSVLGRLMESFSRLTRPREDERIPRAVQRLEKKLTVEPVAKSKLIDVTYEAPDPRLAARVLQTLSACTWKSTWRCTVLRARSISSSSRRTSTARASRVPSSSWPTLRKRRGGLDRPGEGHHAAPAERLRGAAARSRVPPRLPRSSASARSRRSWRRRRRG